MSRGLGDVYKRQVCLGYNQEEAMEEAQRCLGCKKPKCVEGCPVSINIPGFIEEIKEGKIEEAYKVIGLSSALPAICGRVCPQESQCEGKCIRGIKGEPVSIGKLERFVADYALENDIPCYVSLEEKMACGIGACLACVCKSTEIDDHSQVKNKRVCKEGPVFNVKEVEL